MLAMRFVRSPVTRLVVLLLSAAVRHPIACAADWEDWQDRGHATPSLEEQFAEMEMEIDFGDDEKQMVKYRLRVPARLSDSASAAQPASMLVWLHGAGEAGKNSESEKDNKLHLRWLDLVVDSGFSGYILAYQHPKDGPTWAATSGRRHPVETTRKIVAELLNELPIDPDRLYLSGASSGGDGCWEMILRYPDLFAAAAPLACSGAGTRPTSTYCNLPIWVFHCARDPKTPIDGARETVRKVQEAGGSVFLTETQGKTHDCWTPAFTTFRLPQWLDQQEKGVAGPEPNWRTPMTTATLRAWLDDTGLLFHLPVPAAALVLMVLAGANSRRSAKQSRDHPLQERDESEVLE